MSIILILALGIGANAAIFSILDPLLLRKLPVQRPDELIAIGSSGSLGSLEISEAQAFYTYREQSQVFSGVLAFAPQTDYEIVRNGEAETVPGQVVSGDYFSVLGVRAIAGRMLVPQDEQSGQVAVLSYEYCRRAFGSNQAAIGQTLRLNNQAYTVVGVAPPGFFGLEVGKSPDLYLPLIPRGSGHNDWVQIFGRLKPDISLQQATAALEGTFADTVRNSSLPQVEIDQWITRLSLNDASKGVSELRSQYHLAVLIFSQYRLAVLILMAVVLLIMLIACTNVSNLILARAIARRREFALKQALGADRGTLIRQLLIETGLMISLAAVAGLLLGHWARSLLIAAISSERTPIVLPSAIDLRFLLFAGGLLAITMLLSGMAPMLFASRLDLVSELKVQTSGSAASGSRFSSLGVIGQVAISVALLVGSGLLLHSLVALETHDVGFDRDNVLLVTLGPRAIASQPPNVTEFNRQLLNRLKLNPDVRSATFSRFSPISGTETGINVAADGYGLRPGETTLAFFVQVSAGYFQTLAIPLLGGRDFDGRDIQSPQRVAIMNETMARNLFGNNDCIGRHFKLIEGDRSLEIIGLVRDSKYNDLRESATNFFYLPGVSPEQTLQIRTKGDPKILVSSVRALIESLGTAFKIGAIKTLHEQVDESVRLERVITMVCTSFGILALNLTCAGLYGIVSFRVAQRTKEVGIRVTLGASPATIMRLVIGEGLLLTTLGIVLGSIGAAAVSWVLKKMLFGTGVADPLTLVAVPLLLMLSTVAAGYVPARRASKVDPIVALRYE